MRTLHSTIATMLADRAAIEASDDERPTDVYFAVSDLDDVTGWDLEDVAYTASERAWFRQAVRS